MQRPSLTLGAFVWSTFVSKRILYISSILHFYGPLPHKNQYQIRVCVTIHLYERNREHVRFMKRIAVFFLLSHIPFSEFPSSPAHSSTFSTNRRKTSNKSFQARQISRHRPTHPTTSCQLNSSSTIFIQRIKKKKKTELNFSSPSKYQSTWNRKKNQDHFLNGEKTAGERHHTRSAHPRDLKLIKKIAYMPAFEKKGRLLLLSNKKWKIDQRFQRVYLAADIWTQKKKTHSFKMNIELSVYKKQEDLK